MKDIANDIQDWAKITLKNVSGGTGYPPNYDWREPKGSASGKRYNPVPAAFMPNRLALIDLALTSLDEHLFMATMAKHLMSDSDATKAQSLGVSVQQYYRLVRDASMFIKGVYAGGKYTHFSSTKRDIAT